jgi:imidazolonepropionase-like amidohydrolase
MLAPTARSGQPGSVATQPITVISGGRALVGTDLRPVDDAVVVLRGDEIVAAGRASEVVPPSPANTIDATGTTVAPGFIDAHVHIGFAAPASVVVGGVTTVRDLAWPPERIWKLVARSRAPDFEGPRIVAAGQMLTAPGGYPLTASWAPAGTGRVVAGPGEAHAAVGEQADRGASVIKVALNPPAGPVLDGSTLAAIVSAAHQRGLRVTGHVHGLRELGKAMDAGVDELAHMLMSSEPIPDRLIEGMVDQHMTIVPTLAVRFGRDRRLAVDNLRRFSTAGGRVVYGTDLGNAGPRPGIDPREVKSMARAGMSPLDIIASATVESARYLELDRAGVLAPGMRADIVVLRGDATADIKALTRVEMVWKDGRLRT